MVKKRPYPVIDRPGYPILIYSWFFHATRLLPPRGSRVVRPKLSVEHGVAVEINSNPWRLNLDWRWYQRGLELGCMFSIDPDAHSTSEIDHVRWGVSLARKGGIPPGPILNSLGLKDFTAFLHDRKQRLASGPKTRRSPARSEART
jgi:DNA polymerase (family 10)